MHVALIVFLVIIGIPINFIIWQSIVRIIRKIHPFPIPQFVTDLIDNPMRRTEKKWAAKAGLVFKGEYGNWFAYKLHFSKE